ncbi:hypothetical protein TFLX_06007 [Thermoflexales bacterium]|nr:hypothetical protein TFLX_06007 [Thermoflexales bacterium]
MIPKEEAYSPNEMIDRTPATHNTAHQAKGIETCLK